MANGPETEVVQETETNPLIEGAATFLDVISGGRGSDRVARRRKEIEDRKIEANQEYRAQQQEKRAANAEERAAAKAQREAADAKKGLEIEQNHNFIKDYKFALEDYIEYGDFSSIRNLFKLHGERLAKMGYAGATLLNLDDPEHVKLLRSKNIAQGMIDSPEGRKQLLNSTLFVYTDAEGNTDLALMPRVLDRVKAEYLPSRMIKKSQENFTSLYDSNKEMLEQERAALEEGGGGPVPESDEKALDVLIRRADARIDALSPDSPEYAREVAHKKRLEESKASFKDLSGAEVDKESIRLKRQQTRTSGQEENNKKQLFQFRKEKHPKEMALLEADTAEALRKAEKANLEALDLIDEKLAGLVDERLNIKAKYANLPATPENRARFQEEMNAVNVKEGRLKAGSAQHLRLVVEDNQFYDQLEETEGETETETEAEPTPAPAPAPAKKTAPVVDPLKPQEQGLEDEPGVTVATNTPEERATFVSGLTGLLNERRSLDAQETDDIVARRIDNSTLSPEAKKNYRTLYRAANPRNIELTLIAKPANDSQEAKDQAKRDRENKLDTRSNDIYKSAAAIINDPDTTPEERAEVYAFAGEALTKLAKQRELNGVKFDEPGVEIQRRSRVLRQGTDLARSGLAGPNADPESLELFMETYKPSMGPVDKLFRKLTKLTGVDLTGDRVGQNAVAAFTLQERLKSLYITGATETEGEFVRAEPAKLDEIIADPHIGMVNLNTGLTIAESDAKDNIRQSENYADKLEAEQWLREIREGKAKALSVAWATAGDESAKEKFVKIVAGSESQETYDMFQEAIRELAWKQIREAQL